MSLRLRSVLLGLCLVTGAGYAADESLVSFQLPNGMRVVLAPQAGVEAACVMVYHRFGVADDPADLRGATHLFQNLMFNGTEHVEPYDHQLLIDRSGGSTTTRVGYDNAVFADTVSSEEVPLALWLAAERLRSLRLDNSLIERAKAQSAARLARLAEVSPIYRAQTWIHAQLFAGTPYEMPLGGDPAKVRQFRPERIRDTYRRFQNPADILLVVAGKFDLAQLRQGIGKNFQDLPGGRPSPQPLRPLPDLFTKANVQNWLVEGLAQPFLVVGFRFPYRQSPEYTPALVLAHYLVDARVSRLQAAMDSAGVAVTVSGSLTEYLGGNGLVIQLVADRRIELERAKYVLQHVLASLAQNPISQRELTELRNLMELDYYRNWAVPEGRCLEIALQVHLTGDLPGEKGDGGRFRRVDHYDLVRIAQKYLKWNQRVQLNVLPDR